MQELREMTLMSTGPAPIAYAEVRMICLVAVQLDESKLLGFKFGSAPDGEPLSVTTHLPLPPIRRLGVMDCYIPRSVVEELLRDLSGTVEKLEIDFKDSNKSNASYMRVISTLGPRLLDLDITTS